MENGKFIKDLIKVAIAIVLIIIANILTPTYPDLVPFIWGAAFIIGGYAKAVEGVKKTIEAKSLNVEFLMIAAATGAFIVNDYAEGAILILIFAVSGVLEAYATSRSHKALTSLLTLAPKVATKIVKGKEEVVDISTLKIKDIVLVKVGQLIPADGVIFKGSATIDQSAITGEYIPVYRKLRDNVFAGSLVTDSAIQVQVSKDPRDSVVQKIIDFVTSAQENKNKTQTLIEKIERYYVYVVIAMAVGMMFIPYWLNIWTFDVSLYRGIIVLVVGSPCALVASTTPAVLSSLSYGAKRGILIKGGEHIERLNDIDTVILDKTGTITEGKPVINKVVKLYPNKFKDFERMVFTMEQQSNHPLAKAIADYYSKLKSIPLKTKEIPGRGMEAKYNNQLWQVGRFPSDNEELLNKLTKQGLTYIKVIVDHKLIGYITVKDKLRLNIKNVIKELHQQKIEVLMLTGDNQENAKVIAKEVGITQFVAEVLPQGKVDVILDLIKRNKVPLMIGDGINDAPALASAHVGVAMGEGTDVSLETADIVFMNNKMENIPQLFKIAKSMQRIVIQNVVFSLSVIVLLMVSNVFQLIELPTGVIAHEGSTVIVVLNSLRLLLKK
jgi:Cd2+/Zn2+-exporting ATPase